MSIIITYKLKADCYLYKTFTLVCVSFRCTNYTGVELIEELIMQIQKLYSKIKPYAAMSVLVLGISSLSVNAMGHKNDNHNPEKRQQQGEGHNKQHAMMKKHLHRLAKKLDLTSEQRSELNVIFAGIKEDRIAHKPDLTGFNEQVKSLLQVSKFDENKFEAIYAEFQPTFQKMATDKAKIRHAIMQVLTPEQQQKYLTMGKHR